MANNPSKTWYVIAVALDNNSKPYGVVGIDYDASVPKDMWEKSGNPNEILNSTILTSADVEKRHAAGEIFKNLVFKGDKLDAKASALAKFPSYKVSEQKLVKLAKTYMKIDECDGGDFGKLVLLATAPNKGLWCDQSVVTYNKYKVIDARVPMLEATSAEAPAKTAAAPAEAAKTAEHPAEASSTTGTPDISLDYCYAVAHTAPTKEKQAGIVIISVPSLEENFSAENLNKTEVLPQRVITMKEAKEHMLNGVVFKNVVTSNVVKDGVTRSRLEFPGCDVSLMPKLDANMQLISGSAETRVILTKLLYENEAYFRTLTYDGTLRWEKEDALIADGHPLLNGSVYHNVTGKQYISDMRGGYTTYMYKANKGLITGINTEQSGEDLSDEDKEAQEEFEKATAVTMDVKEDISATSQYDALVETSNIVTDEDRKKYDGLTDEEILHRKRQQLMQIEQKLREAGMGHYITQKFNFGNPELIRAATEDANNPEKGMYARDAKGNPILDEEGNLTYDTKVKASVNDRMQKVIRIVREATPAFYYLLRMTVITFSTQIPTMCVCLTPPAGELQMMISPEFVRQHTNEELTAVIYHEIYHIICGHLNRTGTRNPRVWNIATDMIVNACINEDFEMGGEPTKSKKLHVPRNTDRYYSLRLPEGCVFSKKVDTRNDTAESIYEELMNSGGFHADDEEMPPSPGGDDASQDGGGSGGASSSGGSGSSGSSGQGSSSSGGSGGSGGSSGQSNSNSGGSGGSDGSDEQQGGSNGQQGGSNGQQGGNQQSGNSGGQNGNQQGSGSGGQNGNQQGSGSGGQNGNQQGSGSGGQNSGNKPKNGKDGYIRGHVIFRGEKKEVLIPPDVIGTAGDKDGGGADGDDGLGGGVGNNENGSQSRGAEGHGDNVRGSHMSKITKQYNAPVEGLEPPTLSDATIDEWVHNMRRRIKDELQRQQTNNRCNSLGEYLDITDGNAVDWQSELRNLFNKAVIQDTSFQTPDRRFQYQVRAGGRGLPVAGPYKRIAGLDHIFFAVDTSGSMSKDDIETALTYAYTALIQTKRKHGGSGLDPRATIVTWDTEVGSVHKRVKPADIIGGIQLTGGGGTTFACVLAWLHENRREFADPSNPNIPCAYVVVTDGYIEPMTEIPNIDKSLQKKFLWIITDNHHYETFNPPFGKKVKLHLMK